MRFALILVVLFGLGACVRAISPGGAPGAGDGAVRDVGSGVDASDARRAQDAGGEQAQDLGVRTPTLDPSFADQGLFRLFGGETSAQLKRLVFDSKGRLVVTGHGVPPSGTLSAIVARLLPDGTLDPSFNNGTSLIADGGAGTHVFSLALTADDQILVGGQLNNPSRYFVFKWLESGVANDAFGTGGLATFTRDLEIQRVRGIVAHADASLSLVAASEPVGQASSYAHVTMQSDGSLRPDAEGTTVNNASSASIAQVAGKEIIVSRHFDSDLGRNNVLAARFVDGQLDPSYGQDGLAARDVVPRDQNVWSFAADSAGRLYICFTVATNTSGVTNSGITRFTADGTLDTAYGNAGFVEIIPGLVSAPKGVVLDARGRLVVVGSTRTTVDGPGDLFISRVLPDGSLDSSFSPAGSTRVVDLGGDEEGVRRGVLDEQGRLLVVGWSGLNGTDGGWITRWLLPD